MSLSLKFSSRGSAHQDLELPNCGLLVMVVVFVRCHGWLSFPWDFLPATAHDAHTHAHRLWKLTNGLRAIYVVAVEKDSILQERFSYRLSYVVTIPCLPSLAHVFLNLREKQTSSQHSSLLGFYPFPLKIPTSYCSIYCYRYFFVVGICFGFCVIRSFYLSQGFVPLGLQ